MTRIERQNYRIAVVLSIFLHGLLFFIVFPAGVFDGNTTLDTYSAGLIDLAGSTEDVAAEVQPLPEPVKPQAVSAPKVASSEKRPAPVPERPVRRDEKTVEKPKPAENPKPVEESKTLEKSKTPEKPEQVERVKPEPPQPEPASPKAAASENGGGGGIGPGENQGKPPVKSLGDGSGMFSKRGLVRQPTYPKNALNEGKEGDVVLRVLVSANGTIEGVEIRQPSGDSRLDKSAQDYIRKEWHFNPNDQSYYVDVLFMFRIQAPMVDYRLLGSKTRP